MKKLTDFKDLLATLRADLNIFSEFMIHACRPYKKLFTDEPSPNFPELVATFLSTTGGINKLIRKIIVSASRSFYTQKV
jgi:hypothetical protein